MVGTRGDLKVSSGFGELQVLSLLCLILPAVTAQIPVGGSRSLPLLGPAAFLQECEKPDLEGAEIACSLDKDELCWPLLLPSTSPKALQTQLHAIYPHQVERSTGGASPSRVHCMEKGVHLIQGSLVTWQSALGCN